jgi:hypothetical protein
MAPNGSVATESLQADVAGHSLYAVGRAHLAEDVLDVQLDCVQRDDQFVGTWALSIGAPALGGREESGEPHLDRA